ncbi:EAL domain-containing protein [Caulobacter segnis]|uniref:sensor domain-containing phosphodiesterase n=1 Tax=Caulobacter segnis TaxID=88688 RepID=UPI00240F10C6|nr:EAL domain-containing protein [Caulobacter segnis]MDG2522695.1 EAL domain-containing protein [Caulobacter segnis]
MTLDPYRLLGLAFASSDLLLELDDYGRITFVAGAEHELFGHGAPITGMLLHDLLAPPERERLHHFLLALADGGRHGPIVLAPAHDPESPISLSARRLAENAGRICCALTAAPPLAKFETGPVNVAPYAPPPVAAATAVAQPAVQAVEPEPVAPPQPAVMADLPPDMAVPPPVEAPPPSPPEVVEPVAQAAASQNTRAMHRAMARAEALAAAVSQRRFNFAFQPVVRLADDTVHHHEVLARFDNGADPLQMIRTAQAFDLMEELDYAVVEQAIRRLASDVPTLRLAVKVTGRTLCDEGYAFHVERLLRRHEGARGRLIFELTESNTITDMVLANRYAQVLRGMGSLVCLGDFGAGADSMAHLQRLQLDLAKIDGRYVRELTGGREEAALVRHLVQAFSELGLRTVAAMVENTGVEEAARYAGVDFAQGYLYGRPTERPQNPQMRRAAPVAPPLLRLA